VYSVHSTLSEHVPLCPDVVESSELLEYHVGSGFMAAPVVPAGRGSRTRKAAPFAFRSEERHTGKDAAIDGRGAAEGRRPDGGGFRATVLVVSGGG
jgi:hypothetical protein